MLKLGILISGRGSNMKAILKAIKNKKIPAKAAVVISNTASAGGLETAKKMGVDTEVIPSAGFAGSRAQYDMKIMQALKRYDVTKKGGLVCLAGFMRIIGPEFVKIYKNRILNIHPALLPAFPGLDAQGQAIKYGSKITGCTVHFVDEGVDTGRIILQASVEVKENDTRDTLAARILKQEHRIYPKAVEIVAKNLARTTIKGTAAKTRRR